MQQVQFNSFAILQQSSCKRSLSLADVKNEGGISYIKESCVDIDSRATGNAHTMQSSYAWRALSSQQKGRLGTLTTLSILASSNSHSWSLSVTASLSLIQISSCLSWEERVLCHFCSRFCSIASCVRSLVSALPCSNLSCRAGHSYSDWQ